MGSNRASRAVSTGSMLLLVWLASGSVGTGAVQAAGPVADELALPGLGSAAEVAELRPLALASADFDGDGVRDLAVGLGRGGSGAVAVYRGNVDALFPYSPAARARRDAGAFTDAPFAATPFVAAVPVDADFLVAGDFDNDGHWDVAAAARGGTTLEWLRGDGNGRFALAAAVGLPGRVTAMTAGEVNRRDGIDDVVVAVLGAGGAQLLVFESPLGALRAAPEVHALPAPASDVALGFLDSLQPSVAAVSGNQLVLVHGRDRRLSLDQARRAAVPAAVVTTFRLPSPAAAVAFSWSGDTRAGELVVLLADGSVAAVDGRRAAEPTGGALALLTTTGSAVGARARLVAARSSGGPTPDLYVVDQEAGELSLLELDRAAATVHRRRLAVGSLAPAARARRVAPPALQSLLVLRGELAPALLAVTTPTDATFVVTSNDDDADAALDGVCETAPGNGECTLRAALEEANATPAPDAVSFAGMAAGDHLIFPRRALPVIQQPVTVDGWTHVDGKIELDGIAAGVASGLTVVGGSSTLRGLAIRTFENDGVQLTTGGFNVVEACHVGDTDYGIVMSSSSGNQVGSAVVYSRNVLGWNVTGIMISGGSLNAVEGSTIGLDFTGTGLAANQTGIAVVSGDGNQVGGAAPGEGNLISGNTLSLGGGVYLEDARDTLILGNLVGTDVTGLLDKGNSTGIRLNQASSLSLGSTAALGSNTISGNTTGIVVTGYAPIPASGIQIQNNLIGTDATGMLALPNGWNPTSSYGGGLITDSWAGDLVIGGAVTGTANVISGNFNSGVYFSSNTNNAVLGNMIGTDVTGLNPLPNSKAGVLLVGSSSCAIGGSGPGEGNLIAFNLGDGVTIKSGGLFNSVLGNDYASNGGLPVDLDDNGVSANDPGDGDGGTNRLMNFPELAAARITAAGEVEVTYTVSSDPVNADYDVLVELFVADSAVVSAPLSSFGYDSWTTADFANGSATVVVGSAAALGVSEGQWIVATATDQDGNSSELGGFTRLEQVLFADAFESGSTDAWSLTVQDGEAARK